MKLEERIDAAWQARREGRHEAARRELLEVITTSRKAGKRLVLIRALTALAHVVRDRGEDERALPLYEEAITLCRDEGDDLLLAHTVRHLGDLHRATGRLLEAEPYYDEALTLYRRAATPPPLDYANALSPMALLKRDQGDIDMARRLWSEARALYESVGIDVPQEPE